MFHELTGDPHDSSAVQSALRLQLRQARLAKKKPTCLEGHIQKKLPIFGFRTRLYLN